MWVAHSIKEVIKIRNFYTFFSVHFKDGFNFYGESHNFWECLYVIDGKVCVSADEKVYNLSSGEIIFHKPLEMHKFYIDNKNGATLLIFSFDIEGSKSDYFKEKVFMLSPEQKNIIDSLLEYVDKDLTFKISKNYLEPFDSSDIYSQAVSTYIHQLFLFLLENENLSQNATDPHAIIYKKAVNYMKSMVSAQVSVEDVAKKCNISTSSLKRIFYKYSGLSIHKYFLTLKINTAANMLKNGESVTQVAQTLDFSSQGYFSKVFKRETGINPTQIKS